MKVGSYVKAHLVENWLGIIIQEREMENNPFARNLLGRKFVVKFRDGVIMEVRERFLEELTFEEYFLQVI